ncbi:hypothetical protein ACMFMG_002357 [Clarireedia jacksonii]
MSGIEVAGLVLGALPILFQAVGCYRDSLGMVKLFFRERKYVDKLAHALLLQKQMLEETLKSVIIESGCRDIPDLFDNPLDYFNDLQTQKTVTGYLGSANTRVLNGALSEIKEIIEKIAGSISGLVPAINSPTNDLLQIIEANQRTSKQLDLLPRVKLMFDSKKLMAFVQELSQTTSSLNTLTQTILTNRRNFQNDPSGNAIRIAKAFRQVRSLAIDLQIALSGAWKSDCHRKHEAKLLLEDRVDATADILGPNSQVAFTPRLSFKIILAAEFTQDQILWNETAIRVQYPTRLGNNSVTSTSKGKSVATQASPNQKPVVTTVSDICNIIQTTKHDQNPIALVLTENHQVGMTPAENSIWIVHRQPDTASLERLFLQSTKSPRKVPTIPLKLRMFTALALSSNLLQLSQTHWLKVPWSKDMVNFLIKNQNPIKNTPYHPVELHGPFISLTFDATAPASACLTTQIEPKKALLELGILLLEIWHETTLELRFGLDKAPTGYYERLALAVEWRDDVNNEPLELYARAVSNCIQPNVEGDFRLTDWESMKLWEAICGNVVEPLAKICKQWR